MMETNSVQQEILLITGTSFSLRQTPDNGTSQHQENFTHTEQLEAACWNGLLDEMLPEIVDKSTIQKKLYLWEIRQANSFLEIELGEYPQAIDAAFSIDPYAFLATVCYA